MSLIDRIKNEPVLVTTLVGAIINLVVAFGLALTEAQEAGILGVTAAILAFVARSKVVPARKVDSYQPEHAAQGH